MLSGKGVIDRDLRFIEVNETLASFGGASIHDFIGCVVSRAVPTLAPALEPLLQQVFASGKPSVDVEVETLAHANRRRWRVSCFPVQARSGMVLAVDVLVQEAPPVPPVSPVVVGACMARGNAAPWQLIVEVCAPDHRAARRGITVTSKVGKGTTFTMRLPL